MLVVERKIFFIPQVFGSGGLLFENADNQFTFKNNLY